MATEDIDDKLLELQERSEHRNFEHVGYITHIEDRLESYGDIKVTVSYPDGETSFEHYLDWPEEYGTDTEIYQFIEADSLPFTVGRMNNESLQNEAVAIDPDSEQIIVPESDRSFNERTGITQLMQKIRTFYNEYGALKLLSVGVMKTTYILSLFVLLATLLVTFVGVIV